MRRTDEEIRQQVFKRDGYRCRYCGSTAGPFHADHVYPYSKGGETSIENMVTACATCNTSKSSKVGLWPKPIGYFDPKPHINALTIFGISDLIAAFGVAIGGELKIALIIFLIGIVLALAGLYTSAAGVRFEETTEDETE